MDGSEFDRLAKSLVASGPRRRMLRLLAALPLGVTLSALLGAAPDATAKDDDHGSSHRRHRRKAKHRHRTGNNKEHRKGKRKGRRRGCNPESRAKTCAGRCGPVIDNCGKRVACDPCTCASGCPQCQTCNPATGLCDPVTDGTGCDDGDSCTQTDTCQGGVCVGSNPVVCGDLDQCHVAGTCDPATGVCSNPNAPNHTTICDGGGVCCNGSCCTGCCGNDGACGACIAFVSSSTHQGDLDGLSGADAICQTLANTATPDSLPGSYKAWLSVNNNFVQCPANGRFRQSGLGYKRVDNAPVANSWTDLVNGGNLINPINRTQNGVDVGTVPVFTNTAINGNSQSGNPGSCSGWDSSSSSLEGRAGATTEVSPTWTNDGISHYCDELNHIYCFQQD